MPDNCPFCDPRQFDERLIAEVDGFYIIATLGQITDGGYVLLVPEEHVSCIGTLSIEQSTVKTRLINRICRALTREYQLRPKSPHLPYPVTLFEHGIVGQTINHAHLHFLPAALDLTPRIQADFPGCEIELTDNYKILELYKKRQEPYLLWASGRVDGFFRVCWNPPAPPQYFRTVVAEMLGRPERANWRQMDPSSDQKLWTETVYRLEDYFV